MSKLAAILEGWENFIFKDEKTEAIARNRATICAGCSDAVPKRFEIIKDSELSEIEGMACKRCGCPLSTLLRQSKKICEKWKQRQPY